MLTIYSSFFNQFVILIVLTKIWCWKMSYTLIFAIIIPIIKRLQKYTFIL